MANVATKEYCSICLETAFISEVKILVVVAAAEKMRGQIYSNGALSNIAL